MAIVTRFKTDYPGVFYIEGKGARGPERIYYIRYRSDGKQVEEKAGRQYQDDMTPAKASGLRAQRIDKKDQSNQGKRKKAQQAKRDAEERWTIERLWEAYKEDRPDIKGIATDEYRYKKYLAQFGDKEPANILQLDVDRLRVTMGKTRAPQTVKHVLILLDRIVNFGVNKGLCPGLVFKVKKPTVQNQVTEDLTEDQIRRLLEVIDNDSNYEVGAMLKMALFTGMRRGEIFKLRWDDIDFRRGVIKIRNPKGGWEQIIPMNELARNLLENHPQGESPLIFPGDNGKQRQSVPKSTRRIRDAAGLPKSFRPFHGLRHVFASMLASSGQVDMYTLQRLLTHMTII